MPAYTRNKYATYEYEILEKMEAGIVLLGWETKSVRRGLADLRGCFVTFHNGEPFLTNIHIGRYPNARLPKEGEMNRSRKLLLKKREIAYLRGKLEQKGLTMVPLSLYTKGRRIKVEIALVRGKKNRDKRETIKKRDLDRDARRSLQAFSR